MRNADRIIAYNDGDHVRNGIYIIKELEKRYAKNRKALRYFLLRCHCGKEFITQISKVKTNHTTSCGCKRINSLKNRTKFPKTPKTLSEYEEKRRRMNEIYYGMIKRCYNKKHSRYKDYGGRGIAVCDEWIKDKQAFMNYMISLDNYGEKGYSIDRIDVNGNYEPNNVRWADAKTQANNKRDIVKSKSGYIFISWSNQRNKWLAYYKADNKKVYFGAHEDAHILAKQRDEFLMNGGQRHDS